MSDLSAVAFPHSSLREREVRRILSLFSPLTLCLPWFMDTPEWSRLPEYIPYTGLVFPPEDLKPQGDFIGLMRQYQDWINQSAPGGYPVFLYTAREMLLNDDNSWDIRKDIRSNMEKTPAPDASDTRLRPNIILHLARKMEENRLETFEALEILKERENPLKEALGEEAPSHETFGEILPTGGNTYMNENILRSITEAWLELFADYVKDFKIILTLDESIEAFVREFFEETTEYSGLPERLPWTRATIPDSPLFNEDAPEGTNNAPHHNIKAESILTEILNSLENQPRDSAGDETTDLSRELEKAYSTRPSDKSFSVKMTFLTPLPRGSTAEEEPINRILGGKILVLLGREGGF